MPSVQFFLALKPRKPTPGSINYHGMAWAKILQFVVWVTQFNLPKKYPLLKFANSFCKCLYFLLFGGSIDNCEQSLVKCAQNCTVIGTWIGIEQGSAKESQNSRSNSSHKNKSMYNVHLL